MSNLKILCEENIDGVVYVELEGSVDVHNFERLEALFAKYTEDGIYCFVVNISLVETISSTGAGVFISTVGTCKDNGGNLVLLRPSREFRDVLELLGVFHIFPAVESRDEALALFRKKAV